MNPTSSIWTSSRDRCSASDPAEHDIIDADDASLAAAAPSAEHTVRPPADSAGPGTVRTAPPRCTPVRAVDGSWVGDTPNLRRNHAAATRRSAHPTVRAAASTDRTLSSISRANSVVRTSVSHRIGDTPNSVVKRRVSWDFDNATAAATSASRQDRATSLSINSVARRASEVTGRAVSRPTPLVVRAGMAESMTSEGRATSTAWANSAMSLAAAPGPVSWEIVLILRSTGSVWANRVAPGRKNSARPSHPAGCSPGSTCSGGGQCPQHVGTQERLIQIDRPRAHLRQGHGLTPHSTA